MSGLSTRLLCYQREGDGVVLSVEKFERDVFFGPVINIVINIVVAVDDSAALEQSVGGSIA